MNYIKINNTRLRDMTAVDVDDVLRIEQQVHSHPWTSGNFRDSLGSGHICKVFESANEVAGYAVLMPVLEEVQLLDIGIARPFQRKGLGKKLLEELLELARTQKFERVILEVRVTNIAANALYKSAGFTKAGLRRGYYPGQNGREDAVIMEYKLP
jgi:ribosomal-protein-alanine N-acetyltransferase